MTSSLVFPDLIHFEEYNGDFSKYLQAVYSIFHKDFIHSYPSYENVRVSVRKYPEVEGMHRTFYHMTHEGEDEENRQPDIRRMERIRFPRFVVDNHVHDTILVWKNRRGKDTRTLLYSETENYLVVLTERKEYYLFITAYLVERKHRQDKLLKEYEEYIKTKTA